MPTVVRLAPLALLQRRASRMKELRRIFGTDVDLDEVSSVQELRSVVAATGAIAVILDAPRPGDLGDAVKAAGSLPILRPLWREQRNSRGEIDEVFAGYGRLSGDRIVALADGELASG